MKNSKSKKLSTFNLKTAIRILTVAVIVVVILFQSMPSSALPAAKYRYRSSQCGRSDSECMKYSAEAGVFRLYRGIFNRNPDNGGMAFWAQRLQSGTSSTTDMAASLLGSSEWRSAHQNLNNAQFVNQTYQFALKRAADTNGYNYWLGKLNGGTSKAHMVASIIGSSESANVWHGTFMSIYYPEPVNPPQPPRPPQPPTPPAPPTPPSRPSTPSTPSRTPTPSAPAASTPSESGLQITDLVVSEQSYRSALVTWNTSKPSISKINYSTEQEDLYSEALTEEPVTQHSLRLEGDSVLAGRHYYFRVTAEDESGPVTVDGEFDTKAVAVILTVTNSQDEPLPEVEVLAGDQTYKTDENGELRLEMPEGEQSIFAQKDDLSRELSVTIEVPEEGEDVQRITLSLTKVAVEEATAPAAPTRKKSSPLPQILLVLLLAGLLVGGFLFWRRRNKNKSSNYYGDALEAENYTQEVIPSTPPDQLPAEPAAVPVAAQPPQEEPTPPPMPEPQYTPVADPEIPHHATLPELVGRYGESEQPQVPPQTVADTPTQALSPTGQPVPRHSSLKDLVSIPNQTDQAGMALYPSVDDLPASPVTTPDPQEPPTQAYPDNPQDDALTIKH